MWSALRAIEGTIELRKRMANRARSRNLTAVVPSLELDIAAYESRADALRELLLRPGGNGNRKGRRLVRRRRTSHDGGKKKG